MERLLARLERRFGGLGIPNLPQIVVSGMVIVFVLSTVRPALVDLMVLDMGLVLRGQVWRLLSFVFLPYNGSSFLFFLSAYWVWLVGTSLESEWGAFRLTLYYVFAILATAVAALITGGAIGSFWLNLSLGLAFSTVFPEYEILLFFVVPMKRKWIGIATALFMAWTLVVGAATVRGAILGALVSYFIFCGGMLLEMLRGQRLQTRQAARRSSMRPAEAPTETRSRQCAICGKREEDGADIRVCTCEKCGGKPRELCLEHARNH